MNGRSSQKITEPGCRNLPLGSKNLSCCLTQGISTSTCLSCMEIGTGVLGFDIGYIYNMKCMKKILKHNKENNIYNFIFTSHLDVLTVNILFLTFLLVIRM